MEMPVSPTRDFPDEFGALRELAFDLCWTSDHEADALWERSMRRLGAAPETLRTSRRSACVRSLPTVRSSPSSNELPARRAYLETPDGLGISYETLGPGF